MEMYNGQAEDDAALAAVGLGAIASWTDALITHAGDPRLAAAWQDAHAEYGRTHDGYVPADGDTYAFSDLCAIALRLYEA
jgi:hypothetical protein